MHGLQGLPGRLQGQEHAWRIVAAFGSSALLLGAIVVIAASGWIWIARSHAIAFSAGAAAVCLEQVVGRRRFYERLNAKTL